MSTEFQQGAAIRPPLLDTKVITKLTDAASELFRVTYDLERTHKQTVKARLATELASVDLFGLTVNRTTAIAEEYQPS